MKYEILSTQVYVYPRGFDIHWTAKNWAAKEGSPLADMPVFGVLSFEKGSEGFTKVHTEAMSEEFCTAVLAQFLRDSLRENEKAAQ